MRLGILTNSYPPNLNGVSVAVVNLEKALVKAGVEVFIATPGVPGVEYQDNVLPLRSTSLPSQVSHDLRFPYNYVSQATKFFRASRVDIIHSQDTMVGGLEAITIANRLKIPAVHTYHTFVEDYDYFRFPGYKQFIRSFSQIVCDGHNAIVAPSLKVKNYLIENRVTSPIYQLPNILIPPKKILSGPNPWLEKYPELTDTFNFLTFGRVAKEKNITLSLELIASLLKQNPNIRYLIAGSGPFVSELQEQINSLELNKQIILVGRYDRDNLGQLCSLAKVFVTTSTSDNLPTTVFEAMYFGLPVIAIEDAAYDFFVDHNINGLLLPKLKLSQAYQEICANSNLRDRLAANAKDKAKMLAKKNWARDYIHLYNLVIAQSKINQRPPNPFLANLQTGYTSFQSYLTKNT